MSTAGLRDQHAKFTTVFRGETVTVEMTAKRRAAELVLEVQFEKDGLPHRVKDLTRQELAALCREAAQHRRKQ